MCTGPNKNTNIKLPTNEHNSHKGVFSGIDSEGILTSSLARKAEGGPHMMLSVWGMTLNHPTAKKKNPKELEHLGLMQKRKPIAQE